MDDMKKFDERLKHLLTTSEVSREELARHLGVAVPVVNRWLNGITAPDVNQLQAIAQFFGMPCQWFLDGGDGFPTAAKLAEKFGLSEVTVKAMLFMAGSEDAEVMGAVDNAIWAVFSAVLTTYKGFYKAMGGKENFE